MQPPELKKGTAAEVALVPHLDQDGAWVTIVLIKQRFEVDRRNEVEPSDGAEVRLADASWEDPEQSSIRYPSDLCVRKPATDIVVVGSAMHAYREPARTLDVLVRVGAVEKVLRVHGTRVWYKGLGGLALTPPEPFEEVPLRWELAWGGADFKKGAQPLEEPRNPLGRGVARDPEKLVHQPGPQLEDPRAPITSARGRQTPVGVGAIGRHWEPRRGFVGTTDELWKRERMPLLPADFDDRFNQVAPPDLVAGGHLRGGELVQLHNVCAEGPLSFELPRLHFYVGALYATHRDEHRPVLDTVLLEPNQRTFDLTWRAIVRMPRRHADLFAIQVHEKRLLS